MPFQCALWLFILSALYFFPCGWSQCRAEEEISSMFLASSSCLSLVHLTKWWRCARLALLSTGACLACPSLLWIPLVHGGIFSLLCADPLLCSAVLHTLLLGRVLCLLSLLSICLVSGLFLLSWRLLNATVWVPLHVKHSVKLWCMWKRGTRVLFLLGMGQSALFPAERNTPMACLAGCEEEAESKSDRIFHWCGTGMF